MGGNANKGKTDWSSIKWDELGATKDGRYVICVKS